MAGNRIAFIHPDLGIGGAERLVVDAAVGLQNLHNEITVYTSHCDKSHCFEEVSADILKVKVYGDFLPTSFFKRFHILFAFLRQVYLTLRLIISGEINQYDYFIIDQLSYCIPIISLFSLGKILFYCHFPDQLLSKNEGKLKSIYRLPFNFIEEYTTGYSDRIVVNSNFTKSMFHKTFTRLSTIDPGIIYPCVDIESSAPESSDINDFFKNSPYFLSINRFEKKKNIELAINAFAIFKKLVPPSTKTKPRLVIAGGYDARVTENVTYLNELTHLCETLKLTSFTIRGKLIIMPPSTDVLFLPSIKSSVKTSLIQNAQMLLYTPSFEHFGIVPVEGMLYKVPVLGVNNGGPLESIVHYNGNNIDIATGFTEEPDHHKWSKILIDFYSNAKSDVKLKLGENGYKRVLDKFSREQMALAFEKNLIEASKTKSKTITFFKYWRLSVLIIFFAILICIYRLY